MIELYNVNKYYDKTVALIDINLFIPPGVCFGLVGPNGAGKSSLMKILAGVIKDYNGSVEFSNSSKKMLGYVPQEICLEETLTASANLKFFGKIYGLNKKEVLASRVDSVLSDIGLVDSAELKVSTFSGGMKRRLNIGCALMDNPNIIVMDEPSVGIDPQSRRYIFKMIHMLKKRGTTIIYASHYMEEVETLCDYVAFIDQGKIVEQGEISNLLNKYGQPGVFIKGNVSNEWFDGENDVQMKDGGFLIKTERPLEVISTLASICQRKQVQPEQLLLTKSRLEDVFFALTGTALRDTYSNGGH